MKWIIPAEYKFGEMDIGEVRYVEYYHDAMRFRRAAAAYRAHHPGWAYKSKMMGMRQFDTCPGMLLWRTA
jgi:hypothetical protein